MTENDKQLEEQRVQLVIGKVGERLEQLQADVGALKTTVVEGRKHFWDEISINVDTHEDFHETFDSIRQMSMVLAESERRHKHSSESLLKLTRLHESPYFGRIDFQEEGQREAESIYIGIASFIDEEANAYYVYDWRAPISSMFYDYAMGPAEYTAPFDTVRGTIELKRQYMIRNGQIRYMFDTSESIGDEVLHQVLGKQADTLMRSIVATIQKEQNQIIRSRGKTVIVQGAAGSGKTSVALQRIAYLLYKFRETVGVEQMVLFSPNPIFNVYVSNVLPELGEANVQQMTFQQYVEHRLGNFLVLEDSFGQLEYTLTAANQPGYEARMQGIRYKASERFYRLIEAYKLELEKTGLVFRDILFREQVLISGEQMRERFYGIDAGKKLANRVEALQQWLQQELDRKEQSIICEAWVEDEIELLDKDDYAHAMRLLRKQGRMEGDTFDDATQEQLVLARLIVQERFQPLREGVKGLTFLDHVGTYAALFANRPLFEQLARSLNDAVPDMWDAICADTIAKLEQGELSNEDAAPLLLLKQLIEGFDTVASVKYVFIDEGQDFTPFQYLLLRRMFRFSRFTILGDFNQAIMAHGSYDQALLPIQRLFGIDETETFNLFRSYRSTRQIVDFTRGLLPEGESIEPFNRSGEPPEIIAAGSREELHRLLFADVERLRTEGIQSVAILCKTEQESVEAYEQLSNLLPVSLIGKHSRAIAEGTLIIPAYLAKGVEFDAVLIYDAGREQYNREQERKLFYTACTRAMHRLLIYYTGALTPFIPAENLESCLKR